MLRKQRKETISIREQSTVSNVKKSGNIIHLKCIGIISSAKEHSEISELVISVFIL